MQFFARNTKHASPSGQARAMPLQLSKFIQAKQPLDELMQQKPDDICRLVWRTGLSQMS